MCDECDVWRLPLPGTVRLAPHDLLPRWDDFEETDFSDVLPEDLEVLSSMISSILGGATVDAMNGEGELLNQDRAALYEAVVNDGFSRLSADGQERLSEIRDVLQEQLAEMVSGSTHPHDVSQYWVQQFDQYEDWEFARLARTESAFAQTTSEVAYMLDDGVRDDAMVEEEAFPPLHPNCMCDVQVMLAGDEMWMYLDTSMEPCIYCNDVADAVIGTIQRLAAA